MKTILFVDHTPFIGGAELVLISHIKQLSKLSSRSKRRPLYRSLVACSKTVPLLIKDYQDAGAEVFVVPFERLKSLNPLVFLRFLRTLKRLYSVIKSQRVDLVVTNTERAMYTGTLAAFITSTPLVWWIRDFEYNRVLLRFLRVIPRRIICVSKAIRGYYGGSDHPKFVVVYVASDFDQKLEAVHSSDVRRVRRELGVKSNDFVIGFVGRLVAWKGAPVLLKAARNLRIKNRNWKIIIVGSGDTQEGNVEAALRRMVWDWGLRDRVIFTGYRNDIPTLMRIFDVFCHTSVKPEPFATVVVEAMLAGIPVIGTNIGGTPEIIEHGYNGFLVAPNNPKELVGVLQRLGENAAVCRQLGENARKVSLSRYTESIVTPLVERLIYRKVLE